MAFHPPFVLVHFLKYDRVMMVRKQIRVVYNNEKSIRYICINIPSLELVTVIHRIT